LGGGCRLFRALSGLLLLILSFSGLSERGLFLLLFDLSRLIGQESFFQFCDLLGLLFSPLTILGSGLFILSQFSDFLLNLFDGSFGVQSFLNLIPSALATGGVFLSVELNLCEFFIGPGISSINLLLFSSLLFAFALGH
jgi:hypothetical protein